MLNCKSKSLQWDNGVFQPKNRNTGANHANQEKSTKAENMRAICLLYVDLSSEDFVIICMGRKQIAATIPTKILRTPTLTNTQRIPQLFGVFRNKYKTECVS